jgi:hypothetical protein
LLGAKNKTSENDDRIVNQLMFVPENYEEIKRLNKLKTILLASSSAFDVVAGQNTFAECPVNTCTISLTSDLSTLEKSDLVIFRDNNGIIPNYFMENKKSHHIYLMYLLESPMHSDQYTLTSFKENIINWTSTYRSDSEIVAPYEKWVNYDENIQQIVQQNKNYAFNKTKKVAWFVSNCSPRNERMIYTTELAKYIQLDIYGACGKLQCERHSKQCDDLLDNDYKFYLSFENSNCHDYITEKFFVNGLKRNILPIVVSKNHLSNSIQSHHFLNFSLKKKDGSETKRI